MIYKRYPVSFSHIPKSRQMIDNQSEILYNIGRYTYFSEWGDFFECKTE